MVRVTLTLEPSRVTGPACVGWSAGGLHAITPRIEGRSITYWVPRNLFEQRALMRLQIIGSTECDEPILPWTQFPVLEEAMFRAELLYGRPVLSPLAGLVQADSRAGLSLLD
jgi:hypothetical protein